MGCSAIPGALSRRDLTMEEYWNVPGPAPSELNVPPDQPDDGTDQPDGIDQPDDGTNRGETEDL